MTGVLVLTYPTQKLWILAELEKKLSENFSIQNNLIECVQQYKYLGIYFCNSGSFAFAQNSYEKKNP